ncbi:MAG: metallophosphoesterase [Caldilineaceae bacterium]|nr:metallophosphoesterase [Caldilineaceae bacterium]
MTPEKMTRIALVTDTHCWPESQHCFGQEGEQLQPWFETIHTAFLEDVRSSGPEILIHLGDFSCGGGTFAMPDADFFAIMQRVNKDFDDSVLHFYGVPGNHDCPAGTNDYSFCEKLLGLSPRLGRTVDTAYARLIFLHSQGHSDEIRRAVLPKDPTYGWIGDAELARLDADLASAGSRPVILFTHQLLHPWANSALYRDLYATANSPAVREILAKYGNVRAVFQGHAHLLDKQEVMLGHSPVSFVVAPSLIQFPLGWLLLSLSPRVLRVQYRALALAELSERSRLAGSTSDWRAGDPAWQDFSIAL